MTAGPGRRWRALLLPGWVDRNLGVILAARFSMSIARAIAGVVTSLYLAAEGFSGTEIGLLFLCVTLASATMSTGAGVLSDRFGRKAFLVVVPLLAAVAAGVYSVARAPAELFVFAALGSFGRGAGAGGGSVGPYQPAESAFVADHVPAAVRADAFGRLAFASSLGALAGGLLAGLAQPGPHLHAAAATAAYRPAFVAAGVLAAVAGLLAFGLREGPPPRHHHEPHGDGRPAMHFPRRSWPALWRFWVTNGVNGVGIGMLGPFVSYWLFRRYGAGPGLIGGLFAIINAGSLFSTLLAARVGRRMGTVRAIVAVRATTGLLLVPMVLAPTFWAAGGIYLVRMLAQRVGLPLRQSFVQDLAHPAERASVAALSNLPAQGTMAGSQVAAGYLFEEVSLAAPFEIAAAFQCLNAACYAILFAWRRPPLPEDADVPGPAAGADVALGAMPVDGGDGDTDG